MQDGLRVSDASERELIRSHVVGRSGGTVSSGVFQRSDALLEREAVTTAPAGRDWSAIGVGLAAAFAVIALYVVGVWAVVILAQALF